jgi:CheY-like chemotaxis protein
MPKFIVHPVESGATSARTKKGRTPESYRGFGRGARSTGPVLMRVRSSGTQRASKHGLMPPGRRDLLIVDDDEDLRLAVADLVEVMSGRHVIGAADLDQVVALGPRALECGLAIVDVNLGPARASGLDVLRWLRQNGYRGKVVFLTGHGRENPQVEQAHQAGGVQVLSKPIAADTLLALVEDV